MSQIIMKLPASVRAEIKRQAAEKPEILTPEDRDEFLASVEPEHRLDAEQAFNDQVEMQERALRDWRDQVLLRILNVSESLLNRGKEVSREPSQQTAPDDWVDTETAASYLDLTPKTVREGAARGTLPGCKYPPRSIRGKWRFKKEDLDRFLKRRQSAPRQQMVERSVWD